MEWLIENGAALAVLTAVGGLFYRFGSVTNKLGNVVAKVDRLDKSLNGDGPWQRKIDSTRKLTEQVKDRMAAKEAEQGKMCAARGVMIEDIEKKLEVIERRHERLDEDAS